MLRRIEDPATRSRLRKLHPPSDYFSEARSSPALWPERILCFARRSRDEINTEPLTRHHHHRCVLLIPWEGEGGIDVDERRFPLSAGSALLIFPFQFHHFHGLSSGPLLWQFITFEMRLPAALEALRTHPLRRLGNEDFSFLSSFTRAWVGPESREGELAPWLSLILDRLQRAPLPSGEKGRKAVHAAPVDSLMARINRHCLPRLRDAFGLKDIATRLGVSESHLRARFRQETGISLGRHVRRLRLQKAMGLLSQSNLSVTQIAERCGFESVFTFSRSFSRFAGVSAKEYRRRLLSDDRHRKC